VHADDAGAGRSIDRARQLADQREAVGGSEFDVAT